MDPIGTAVSFRIRATPEAAYDQFLTADPSRVVRGFGPFPAVRGTSGAVGTWGVAGARRTVHMSDGSRATETITCAKRPGLVAYRVDGFTNALRWLTHEAVAEWRFEASGEGASVAWSYAFVPTSPAASVALSLLVRGPLRAYMRRIACEVRDVAENARG